jgi:hypothetical protein
MASLQAFELPTNVVEPLAYYCLLQSYEGEDKPKVMKKYIQSRIKAGVVEDFVRKLHHYMMERPKENEDLILRVKEKKKLIKLELIDAPCVKIFTPSGLITEDFGKQFDEAYSRRRQAFCIFYHLERKEVCFDDPDTYKSAIQEFKHMRDTGMVVSCADVERKGKKLYALCFGKDGYYPCHFSMACFGLSLQGHAYYFFKKENRDSVFAYLNK